MTNYVIDSNSNLISKYHEEKKTEAINDINYFKTLSIDQTKEIEEISIFLNKSNQSNGYSNFINDESKYIGKVINLYFHKINSIDFIFKIFIEDSSIMQRLINIILNSEFDHHTPMRIVIENYIKESQIKNYFIYY